MGNGWKHLFGGLVGVALLGAESLAAPILVEPGFTDSLVANLPGFTGAFGGTTTESDRKSTRLNSSH